MQDISSEEKKLIRKWIFQIGIFLVCYLPVMLLTAGDFGWEWGWIYFAALFIFLALHPILLVPTNPQLLAERARGTSVEGTKSWDRIITMVAGGIMPFASQLLSFLDHRFLWSHMPLIVNWFGFTLTIIGFGIFLRAMVTNSFFAEGVRIQTKRGHSVCDSGPYRFVRHPGYVGSILSIIGTPLFLGSYWGLIPAGLGAIGYMIRTALEDQTLQEELEGYAEYARHVKYRLIPGIF